MSSTLRVIGPSLSIDQHSVMAPVRATRPNVGRNPVSPQRIDGLTMLPSVSLPIENATSPAAVAAPGPALEPDEPSSSSHGFIVWPPYQMSFARKGAKTQLGDEHGASVMEAPHDRSIFSRHAVLEGLRAIRRRNAGGIKEVLTPPRNPV